MGEEPRREMWWADVEWVEVERYRRWVADVGDGRQLQVMEMVPFGQWGARLYELGFRVSFPDIGGDLVTAPGRPEAMARAMGAAEALGWLPPPESP